MIKLQSFSHADVRLVGLRPREQYELLVFGEYVRIKYILCFEKEMSLKTKEIWGFMLLVASTCAKLFYNFAIYC